MRLDDVLKFANHLLRENRDKIFSCRRDISRDCRRLGREKESGLLEAHHIEMLEGYSNNLVAKVLKFSHVKQNASVERMSNASVCRGITLING